jgi:hypothetical protein
VATELDVALLALNVVQSILLSWVGLQQGKSSAERRRRHQDEDSETNP